MADLRKLKDKAAELAAKGKVEKAAEVFREILRADPRDVASCQKLADVLRRGGEIAEAVERYAEVAERFGRDGLLIKAIAICKTILELDPEHARTQKMLAELYAKRAVTDAARRPLRTMLAIPVVHSSAGDVTAQPSNPAPAMVAIELPMDPGSQAKVDLSGLPPELQPPTGSIPLAPPPPSGRHITALDLIVAAADEATESGVAEEVSVEADAVDEEALELLEVEPETEAAPRLADERLPRIPIFSDLGSEAFVALTEGLSVLRLNPGEVVIGQGEEGTDFYAVASGRLSVRRRDERGEQVVLAHLGDGEFFGEMALLSGAPRNATVAAEEPSELLVLRADVLRGLAGRYPHLADSLRRFYRQRLLANALAISPLFRTLGRADRKAVMERFRERRVRDSDVIVREGIPSDGLYVVMEGVLDVTRSKDGASVLVGHLREGDLFGEMSCLRKVGASASVIARRAGSVLRLPRTDFDALVMTYPTVLELLSELTEERALHLDAVLSGSLACAEDGLVLV
jgi:CRP-like cAMP-binding protein